MQDATRTVYLGIEHKELVYVAMTVSVVLFVWGCWRIWVYVRKSGVKEGEPLPRVSVAAGLGRVARYAFGHMRLLQDKGAGIAHMGIVFGMLVLLVGTVLVAVSYYFYPQLFRGLFYLAFHSLILDLFGLACLLGLTFMIVNRLVLKPERLAGAKKRDALTPSGLLLVVVLGFVVEGARIALTLDPYAAWSPVGLLFSLLFAGLDYNTGLFLYRFAWWTHMLTAFAWIGYIPFGRMSHLITAFFNIYLHDDTEASGQAAPIDFESEDKLGASSSSDLNPKGRLDLLACIECGRCQTLCPAYMRRDTASPRSLILRLKDGADIPEEAIWECTTCGACMELCPVMIDHVPKIIEQRRYKAMELAEFPEQLEGVVRNLETRTHPFRGVMSSREDWCEGLSAPLISDVEQADVLFWVGCAASFDERNQKIARAFVQILQATGTDFAILGNEEPCCGDVARRIGNELEFETTALGTLDLLGRYAFNRIVCICPHCSWVLGKEYRQFGADFTVQHHTQFIREAGLSLATKGGMEVTYHDPCYLGRWGGSYEDARAILGDVSEMPRNRARALCCGGGGGHAFMEDRGFKRVSEIRARESVGTGAKMLCTACPYCMQMLEDGMKAINELGEPPVVMDIAELVNEQVDKKATG